MSSQPEMGVITLCGDETARGQKHRAEAWLTPLGPRVTPTASASLLMPTCILRLDSLSKTMSLDTACTYTELRISCVRDGARGASTKWKTTGISMAVRTIVAHPQYLSKASLSPAMSWDLLTSGHRRRHQSTAQIYVVIALLCLSACI